MRGRQRDLGARAQIEETSLGRPSVADIKVKTLFGSNNGRRHSPGVRRAVACLRSQNPPLTAESLDYQTNRCKPPRTISSADPGRGTVPPETQTKKLQAQMWHFQTHQCFLSKFPKFKFTSGPQTLEPASNSDLLRGHGDGSHRKLGPGRHVWRALMFHRL